MTRLREGRVGGVAEKLHGTGTQPPLGIKRDRTECISRAIMVGRIIPALVCASTSTYMARGAGSRMHAQSSQGMDERDICEIVARPGLQVAVKESACLRTLAGAGRNPRVSPLAAGREAQEANKFPQTFRSVVMAALHTTAEPVTAQGVRDVILVDGVTAGARSASAQGGERSHLHADAACILK
jgi:hypothetical protein